MYLMLTFRKEIRNVRVAITAVSSICLKVFGQLWMALSLRQHLEVLQGSEGK